MQSLEAKTGPRITAPWVLAIAASLVIHGGFLHALGRMGLRAKERAGAVIVEFVAVVAAPKAPLFAPAASRPPPRAVEPPPRPRARAARRAPSAPEPRAPAAEPPTDARAEHSEAGGSADSANPIVALADVVEAAVAPSATASIGPAARQGEARAEWVAHRFDEVRTRVQRALEYPPMARRMGWTGRVVISLRVRLDGSVADVAVIESSGRRLLDQGAVDAVLRAAPFPPPPVEADLKVPVTFVLE